MKTVTLKKENTRLMNSLKISIVLTVLALLCPSVSFGALNVLFYDDFDDGDISDWRVENPRNQISGYSPDLLAEGSGYALWGVGSGYSQDPGLNVNLAQDLSISNIGELSIKMRAKSGPQWPNQASVGLYSNDDYYNFLAYGESNRSLDLRGTIHQEEVVDRYYGVGDRVHDWHVYEWHRDLSGNWSISVDDILEYTYNFQEQPLITSFDTIGISLLRNQSAIDWVEVSGAPIPEPATISLLGLGTMALIKRRRA